MQKRLQSLLSVALTAACLACADSTSAGSEVSGWRVERTNVNGTEVVRTVGRGDALALLQENLRLGKLNGAEHEVFGQVYAVVPFSDGSVAIMDRQALRVHYYDRSGQHVRSIGAQGEGPGELRGVSGMTLLPGDRLAIYDPRLRRVSLFSATGDFERAIGVPTSLSSVAVNFLFPTPGGFLIRVNVRPPNATSSDTPTLAAVRFHMESTGQGDTLFPPLLPVDSSLHIPGVLPGEMIPMPLTPTSQWAWHSQGFWVAGTGAEYRLLYIDERGDTLRVVEREATPASISREEAVERRAQTERNMAFRQTGWRWVGPDLPRHKAFFRGIMVTPDGRVWVRKLVEAIRTRPAAEEGTTSGEQTWVEPLAYDVFEASGVFLGEVWPPEGFELLTAYGDQLWSRETDALGVPQVVRYTITFPQLVE